MTSWIIYNCRKSQAFLSQTSGSFRNTVSEFPRGPGVKVHLPCNVGDMSLIPGQGNKIPHAYNMAKRNENYKNKINKIKHYHLGL